MFSSAKSCVLFAVIMTGACRPVAASKVRSTTSTPVGLAAASSLVEGENGKFGITCLGGATESRTKDEILANKVCEKKVTTTSTTAASGSLNAPEAASGISLSIGAPSYLKTEPIDCTAGAPCVENENSCRVEVGSAPVTLKVKSISPNPMRSYDHIVAERFPSAGCKLPTVHIYFPHLVVPLQLAIDTPVGAGCVLPAGTTLEGAIMQDPKTPIFNFMVSKGSGCAAVGSVLTGMNVRSLAQPSSLVRTILGM